jgi:hypothetical protein|tara:strand:- start:58 stop:432 length:375 start_codon:yes stop_codon:yes gene_type:complete
MQTATSTPSKKRAPIATTKVAKPLSKAKVNAIPKPMKTGKGAARKLYKFIGTLPDAKGFTPQMRALILTVSEAKKSEIDSTSFTAQDLVALAVKKGNLTTGQDPLRIFRFYGKRLVKEGYFAEL